MRRTPEGISKSRYLDRLRVEIDRYDALDHATKALFVSEIEQHIEMLRESLEIDGWTGKASEVRAISLMERPEVVAQALHRAEITAKKSSPQCWRGSVVRAWAQYLQVRSTLVLASMVSLVCILAAILLAAIVPGSWQESWIVPLVAGCVFGLTALAGWLLEGSSRQALRPSQLLWGALFALGAQVATYFAESLSAIDSSLATPAAYSALVVTISFFAATAFAGWYFQGARARFRFFRISFPAIFAVLLLATLLGRGLAGAHHGILFGLYALLGVAATYLSRRFVASQGSREHHAGACAR